MRTNYVLIDYESVQVKSLELLQQPHFKVRVFLGANNTKLPSDLAVAIQRFGELADYVQLDTLGHLHQSGEGEGRKRHRRLSAWRVSSRGFWNDVPSRTRRRSDRIRPPSRGPANADAYTKALFQDWKSRPEIGLLMQ